MFRFRVSPRWYVVAFVALPGAALADGVRARRRWPPGRARVEPGHRASSVALGAVVAFALVNWWEEAAWTGLRAPPPAGPHRPGPRQRRHDLDAGDALHLPLVFIAGGVTDGRVAPENIPFYLVALFVLPIPVRMTLTWIYNASGRSVPIAGLYHAGLGVASGAAFIPVLAPSVDPVMVYAGFAALAVIVFVGATRGRLGLPAATKAVVGKEVVAAAA